MDHRDPILNPEFRKKDWLNGPSPYLIPDDAKALLFERSLATNWYGVRDFFLREFRISFPGQIKPEIAKLPCQMHSPFRNNVLNGDQRRTSYLH